MIGRLFVEGVSGRHGIVRGGCLGGTALPIRRPRPRHWRFRELRESVEMRRRACRVIEESKRDPACMKFRFDLHFMRHRGMFGAELVSGFRVVLIKEFAGKKPAFGPPFVPVDEKRGIARRGGRISTAARIFSAWRNLWISAKRKPGSVRSDGGTLARSLSLGASSMTAARALARANTSGPAKAAARKAAAVSLFVEQAIGTEFMVGFFEIAAEIGFHFGFNLRVEVGFAPYRAHESGRLGCLAVVGQSARQSKLARRKSRGRRR